jgi:hypothetical protein
MGLDPGNHKLLKRYDTPQLFMEYWRVEVEVDSLGRSNKECAQQKRIDLVQKTAVKTTITLASVTVNAVENFSS